MLDTTPVAVSLILPKGFQKCFDVLQLLQPHAY